MGCSNRTNKPSDTKNNSHAIRDSSDVECNKQWSSCKESQRSEQATHLLNKAQLDMMFQLKRHQTQRTAVRLQRKLSSYQSTHLPNRVQLHTVIQRWVTPIPPILQLPLYMYQLNAEQHKCCRCRCDFGRWPHYTYSKNSHNRAATHAPFGISQQNRCD